MRTRAGIWKNYWEQLGAERTVPDSHRDDDDYESDQHARWIYEMDRWNGLRSAQSIEAAAYRRLHKLQGKGIPRLYGTCVCHVDGGSHSLDPFISTVPGLIIEFIEGTPLDRLTVGVDVSRSEAERISQGALSVLREFRDALILHGDFAGRNVIARLNDLDHPVIIDLGSARLQSVPRYDGKEWERSAWIQEMVLSKELFQARETLGESGFHIPSPIPEDAEECDKLWPEGHLHRNRRIDSMRREWREALYGPVDILRSDGEAVATSTGGRAYEWEPSRWRICAGISTVNASADYWWGKEEHQ